MVSISKKQLVRFASFSGKMLLIGLGLYFWVNRLKGDPTHGNNKNKLKDILSALFLCVGAFVPIVIASFFFPMPFLQVLGLIPMAFLSASIVGSLATFLIKHLVRGFNYFKYGDTNPSRWLLDNQYKVGDETYEKIALALISLKAAKKEFKEDTFELSRNLPWTKDYQDKIVINKLAEWIKQGALPPETIELSGNRCITKSLNEDYQFSNSLRF